MSDSIVHDRNARTLGAVSAVAAASFLMHVAATAEGTVGDDAIFAAVLADSAIVWPALLSIAHDAQPHSRKVQQDAVSWLSRYAAGVVSGRGNDPFQHGDETDDVDGVKTQAVFVLSQLPDHGGVNPLLDVARSNRDPHVRGSALFWLGQSGDPRALALIESILQRAPDR